MPMLDTIPPEKAEGKIKELYTMFEQVGVPVPLPIQMFSDSPGYISIEGRFINYFINHTSLSLSLLAHIRLMASQEENYTYCINWNTQLITSVLGISKEQVAAATQNPREAALTPEEKALLLFVQKVLRDPALTSQGDADHLRTLGWNNQEIFDATFMGVNMVAMGMMFNAFQMGEVE
jgi:hypothetical protein